MRQTKVYPLKHKYENMCLDQKYQPFRTVWLEHEMTAAMLSWLAIAVNPSQTFKMKINTAQFNDFKIGQ
jgi:hypothetical protein